jgi:4-oxalocrotonate tautomerase
MARLGEAGGAARPEHPGTVCQPARSSTVPFVNVKVIEGVFDADAKRQIVEGVTEAMVAVEGENMRGVTWVVVEEVRSGDWAIGGRALTTGDVRALAAGTS